tara:strand:- start:1 stop:360 length:360 start_codon:yes stop_codon:yes gene_type:complete
MRNWEPFFIENSKIPVWLSYLAPINIGAITLFFLVFSRGKMDKRLKRHETIHFQQMLETLVIGFLFLYLWDYVKGYIKYKDGARAYRRIRAEQEAYGNDGTAGYLQERKRYQWIRKYKV